MNWNTGMRYAAYGVLLGIYGLFTWFGKAPVDTFLTLITGALAALGTSHVADIATNRKEASQQENPKDPS